MSKIGFTGRKDQLRALDSLYQNDAVRACAIIGRRRIGKSSLIKEFIKDKRSLYIQFIESGIYENLAHISSAMSLFLGKETHYDDLEQFFTDLSGEAKRSKTVIVFDEYTYLSETDGTFSSRVQDLIDNSLGDSFVIICGSSVSMMEKEISDSGRPLFGRLHRMYIREMSFEECRAFHPGMSDDDMLALYMTVGGVPYYHIYPQKDTYEGYVTDGFLGDTGLFREEGINIISRELSPYKEYCRILDSIPEGCADTGDISANSGIEITKCKRYLTVLSDLGIVERVRPMADAPKKPVRYCIKDSLIAFHFQILRKNPTSFYGPERIYQYLRPRISTFLGRRFEVFCMDLIKGSYDVLSIGKWWGTVTERDDSGSLIRDRNGKVCTEETDIDIVAELYSDGNDVMLFAECKYTSLPAGISVLNDLVRRTGYVHGKNNVRLMIISRAGFTDDLYEYASETKQVLLAGPDELFEKRMLPRL